MPSIYEFLDYRVFLKKWIEFKSQNLKGIQSKLAASAGVSTTLISRILSGEKNLSLEQAMEVAEYVGFNDTETGYFLLLVEIGKAGSEKLRRKLTADAAAIRQQVATRIQNTSQIDEETKSIYYSSWIYTGIRNLAATPGPHDVNSLAKRLELPNKVVANAVKFLVENKLCVQDEKGIQYASSRTHLGADSPYINHHHRNWRQKAVTQMEQRNPAHLFFTSPMSLSEETANELRQLFPKWIEEVMKKIEPSPSEKVYCLNLDWFEF